MCFINNKIYFNQYERWTNLSLFFMRFNCFITGSYQPSNELMLRFYSYYKQATLGPCKGARPAIWNVVGRAKFDAWKTLGEMTRQAAMDSYVSELHRIVETMSYNDNVANFLEAQTELEAVSLGDLELVAGDVIERVRSQPNSPFGTFSPIFYNKLIMELVDFLLWGCYNFLWILLSKIKICCLTASREASPQRYRSSLETSPASSPSISPPPGVNNVPDSDHSDEEYIDTVDVRNYNIIDYLLCKLAAYFEQVFLKSNYKFLQRWRFRIMCTIIKTNL